MHAHPVSRLPKIVINYFHFFTALPVGRSFQQLYWALRLWTGYQGVGQPVTGDPRHRPCPAIAMGRWLGAIAQALSAVSLRQHLKVAAIRASARPVPWLGPC
jgi:hypothetical protein